MVVDIRETLVSLAASPQQLSAALSKIIRLQRLGAVMKIVSEITDTTAENTEQISAAAQQQMASMEEITASAQALSYMAEELQTKIDTFKS
ncbi:hypothetical protein [Paenibacillus sp. FSL H8-0034]|uniref:hypothetical protein n=1 Tax=Paenibacillus sp. FSL H8-0034 TaxID=2954671 RepID=UPI0030F902B8